MNIKNTPLIALLSMIILVSSCKKNNDSGSNDLSSSMLIKRMAYTDTTGQHYGTSESFQYNSLGRISQMLYDMPQWMDSVLHIFKYYPSKVNVEYFYTNHFKGGRYTYYLNADGLAVADTEITYNQNGDSTISFTYTFIYDQNGYMVEKKIFMGGDTSRWISENYQIVNGNVVSTVFDRADWGSSLTETYEYYPNTGNTLGNANTGRMFLGKSSTNLMKSSLTQYNPPQTAKYTYSIDARNRVVQEFIRGNGYLIGSENLICTYY